MDFSTFSALWLKAQQAAGQPAKAPSHSTYKKFKHVSPEEFEREALPGLVGVFGPGGSRPSAPGVERPVPKLRPRGYVQKACQGARAAFEMPATLPFDTASGFEFVVFTRKPREGKLVADTLSLKVVPEGEEPPGRTVSAHWSAMAAAFIGVTQGPSPNIELLSGELLVAKGSEVTARLVLPDFVAAMEERLGCSGQDDLVVVPFTTDTVYATKSSSPMGCCMLGDMADALQANRQEPDYLTSIPFRVARIDTSSPPHSLLAKGKAPVTWAHYPCWGQKPLVSAPASDGKVRFAVPGSEAQANEFLADVRAGTLPQVTAVSVDYGRDGRPMGSCAGCFKFGEFSKCSRCKQACYCSRACQKEHWKLHKLQCSS